MLYIPWLLWFIGELLHCTCACRILYLYIFVKVGNIQSDLILKSCQEWLIFNFTNRCQQFESGS